MTEPLASFASAVARLRDVLREPESMTQREAAIHCFEFVFELGWKSLQHALRERGVDSVTPRDCLSRAWRLGWIADEEAWLAMLRDRNTTSHTYKPDVALQVYQRLPAHCDAAASLLEQLRAS